MSGILPSLAKRLRYPIRACTVAFAGSIVSEVMFMRTYISKLSGRTCPHLCIYIKQLFFSMIFYPVATLGWSGVPLTNGTCGAYNSDKALLFIIN